jgi:hypothetical protein
VQGSVVTAAREYKDIIGEIRAAAEAVRESDRERAAQLARELPSMLDAIQHAIRRAEHTRFVADLNWEAALDLLWAESWMPLRRRPRPDRSADPARFDWWDDEVERRAEQLREAVRRRRFRFGRR